MEFIDGVEVTRIPVSRAQTFTEAAAKAMGFSGDESSALSSALMAGSLRSHPGQGQGIQQLPKYLARVRSGVVQPSAALDVKVTGTATAIIDASRAAGSVAATRAMRVAIDLARTAGVGAVGVRDSTHLGVVSHYAMQASDQGLIGLVFTNAGPEIAPWGGTRATVGTNPWGAAVPTSEPWPLVLDMANSTSGKGMVRWYLKAGRSIPDDWVLTPEGQRTTDPAVGLDGPLFPLGGPKGYAMAVLVDALTGVLAGASFGLGCFGEAHQNVGHLVIALDIDRFVGLNTFRQRVGDLIAEIRATELMEGVERVWLPGELEWHRSQDRRANGIPIALEAHSGLLALAKELDLDQSLLESAP
jgi:LDH2 family malate/lactate/ureidoglycolate dehydrogenase